MPEAIGSKNPAVSAQPVVENALLKEALNIIESGFEKGPAKPSPGLWGAVKELVGSQRGAVLVPERGPITALKEYFSKVLGKKVPEEAALTASSVVSSSPKPASRHFFPPLPRIEGTRRTESTRGSLGEIDIQLRGQANLASPVPGLSKAGLSWHELSMEKALPGGKGAAELNDAGDALVGRILKSPERVNVTVEDAKLGKLLEVRSAGVPWAARFKSNGEFVGFVERKGDFAKVSTALKAVAGAVALAPAAVTPSQPGQEDDRTQANQPTLLASAAPQAPPASSNQPLTQSVVPTPATTKLGESLSPSTQPDEIQTNKQPEPGVAKRQEPQGVVNKFLEWGKQRIEAVQDASRTYSRNVGAAWAEIKRQDPITQQKLLVGMLASLLSGDAWDRAVPPRFDLNGAAIVTINGVRTTLDGARSMNATINKSLGVSESALVVNEVHGAGLGDFLQVFAYEYLGSVDAPAIQAAAALREGISQKGEVYAVAHSQGSAVFRAALDLLTSEERSKIHYLGLGAQKYIDAKTMGLADAANVRNAGDLVPSLGNEWRISGWLNPREWPRKVSVSWKTANSTKKDFWEHQFEDHYADEVAIWGREKRLVK